MSTDETFVLFGPEYTYLQTQTVHSLYVTVEIVRGTTTQIFALHLTANCECVSHKHENDFEGNIHLYKIFQCKLVGVEFFVCTKMANTHACSKKWYFPFFLGFSG